ncbi:MAG: metalloregulator ArsR/SmtB family transcription factor [Cyclobacteriaceae bacterium]|jgi:DNA-binding transcriptional ArsR family regulator|nr:metalloregulator ArsR/SmtB family transcription factor [Cyclobacteriaceae bacterium]HMR55889.1 metalloregulator ArsR/SmtB family transcription factor [Cyclobacteriaceae bacterium]
MDRTTCIRVFADVNQIKDCKSKIISSDQAFHDLARVLELSGNEVRLKILYLLEEEGELCPCDLSDILGMTVPAISQHLRKLKDGNVIQAKRVGQTIFYSLTADHLKILRPFFKYINRIKEEETKS